jgi:hypothetical protein
MVEVGTDKTQRARSAQFLGAPRQFHALFEGADGMHETLWGLATLERSLQRGAGTSPAASEVPSAN